MADKNSTSLIRKQAGDVSIYEKDSNPAPGVYRSQTAKTIVPKGNVVDAALSTGVEASNKITELPKRVSSFQLMDKHGNEIHHSKREVSPTVAAVRG